MISVQQATDIVLQHPYAPRVTRVPLREAVNCVLATPVQADRDFPPFDRVAMDGIAIRYDEWRNGTRVFKIVGTQAAGAPRQRLSDATSCMEVMTGAVLPEGTDTVIRYEDVVINNGEATVADVSVEKGGSIHHRGVDVREGAVLLQPGQRISPAEIALMASVGKTAVDIKAFPRAALISTGDELVDVASVPGPFQIRRSNTEALWAALRSMHVPAETWHLRDDPDEIQAGIIEIVKSSDVIILSGGVSKGRFDYVPAALEAAGFRKHFHQVSQRPGKPFWFGSDDQGRVAFALPGNPVSTFMCFYRYVKPWLLRSLGVKHVRASAVLAEDFSFAPALTFFLQVRTEVKDGQLLAWPVVGGGSGDFANLAHVDGFLELPLEKTAFRAGEVLPFIPFRA